MKKGCIVILLCISAQLYGQETIDTLIITPTFDAKEVVRLYPGRGITTPKDKNQPKYIDSIRVMWTQINKANQRYYLIVINKRGIKRLEGTFYDAFADGWVIEYDTAGIKKAEGNCELIKLKKPVTLSNTNGVKAIRRFKSEKVGEWKEYYATGETQYIVKYEADLINRKNLVLGSFHRIWWKKYDKQGNLIGERYYKNGKPIKM